MCRRLAVGCWVVIAMFALCGGTALFGLVSDASRVGGPLPETPASTEGDCPREAVLAYAQPNRAARLEKMLEPMKVFSGEGSRAEKLVRLQAIDVAAMIAARDAVLAEPVPPCLEEVRAAEVDLADMMIRVVEHLQAETRDGVGVRGTWAMTVSLVAMVRGMKPRLDRIHASWDTLGERLGIDFEALETPSKGRPTDPPTGG